MAAEPDAKQGSAGELLLIARLALGAASERAGAIDWDRLLRMAADERCVVLAWLRSAPVIRRIAPADVVTKWRARALMAEAAAGDGMRELHALSETLGAAGVSPLVMKGLPLGIMLYGSAAARPVSDTDLFIDASERDAAHAALTAAGWERLYGGRDVEETYRRIEEGRPRFLELHSSLLDDNMLQHLRGPAPEGERVIAGGATIMAHGGPSLPVFLAVHLAKHPHVPLLWWLDFATLWGRLDASRRLEAVTMARAHRLGCFLEWAVAGAGEVATIASSGDDASAHALSRLQERHARHPVVRLARLTAAGDRASVCLAWAFPRADRRHPLTLARRVVERGSGWARRRLSGERGSHRGH